MSTGPEPVFANVVTHSGARASMQMADLTATVERAERLIRGRLASKRLDQDDWEDLCSEAIQRLLLAAQRSSLPGGGIENLTAYALTVADRVFEDYLRRRRPQWCRLRRRLLYLLDGHGHPKSPFARWRIASDWLGGLAAWRGFPFRPSSRYQAFCTAPEDCLAQSLTGETSHSKSLPYLLLALFRWVETPLELNELTRRIAEIQKIEEAPPLSLNSMPENADMSIADAADLASSVLDKLAAFELRAQVWPLVCACPLRQKMTLLLSMEREELLLLATLSEIANALELPPNQMLSLWRTLPLSDRALGERLEITPKQAANLRKCARERIARGLASQELSARRSNEA